MSWTGRSPAQSPTISRIPDPDGQIVFATHAVLPFVGYWAGKSDWHVLIDEELQILTHHQHQIPHTHAIITDHIELQTHNAIYSRMVVRGMDELRQKGRNRDEDELLGHVAELIKTLTNLHRESFVNTEQYQKLRSGECKRLSVHSIPKADRRAGFRPSVHRRGQFQGHGAISGLGRTWELGSGGPRIRHRPPFQSHQNGDLIDIHYATENPWSKKRRGNATAECRKRTPTSFGLPMPLEI